MGKYRSAVLKQYTRPTLPDKRSKRSVVWYTVSESMSHVRDIMRDCKAAFAPETGRPAPLQTCLSCALMRCFTRADVVSRFMVLLVTTGSAGRTLMLDKEGFGRSSVYEVGASRTRITGRACRSSGRLERPGEREWSIKR